MSDKPLPEVFPAVSIDRAYGDKVSDIDIDIAGITDFLRERGARDEDISKLSIHIGRGQLNGVTRGEHAQGRYRHRKKTIETNLIHTLRGASGDWAEEQHSDTLRHELEHFISHHDEDMEKYIELNDATPDSLKLRHHIGATAVALVAAGLTARGYVDSNPDVAKVASLVGVQLASYGGSLVAISRYLRRNWDKYDHYRWNPEEQRAFSAERNDPLPDNSISITLKDKP